MLAPSSLLALVNHFKGTRILGPPDPKLAGRRRRLSRSRRRQGPGQRERASRSPLPAITTCW
ncbi:MAG: hypothetical protein U1E33_06260 [Rhodospirillales bacterium]